MEDQYQCLNPTQKATLFLKGLEYFGTLSSNALARKRALSEKCCIASLDGIDSLGQDEIEGLLLRVLGGAISQATPIKVTTVPAHTQAVCGLCFYLEENSWATPRIGNEPRPFVSLRWTYPRTQVRMPKIMLCDNY